MSSRSPIFPIAEPQHFSDYGFDPQIDYFQVLEEARKYNKREAARSVENHHFKLQKPISRDESSKKIKKSKKRWWRNPLISLFKWRKRAGPAGQAFDHPFRARIGSISGPIYVTESRSGSSTPFRTASLPGSGPLSMNGDVGIPYVSLRELNMDQQHRISTTAMPIYLVT